jgi:hypothetical protein
LPPAPRWPTAPASNTLTATVSTFSDALRNPNAVLRKNAALNFINSQLNQSFANVVPAGATLSPAAFLRQTARAVLSVGVSTVPAGATDLGATDPITGFEQFTYDPNGTFTLSIRTTSTVTASSISMTPSWSTTATAKATPI